jgi:hypothetical protein
VGTGAEKARLPQVLTCWRPGLFHFSGGRLATTVAPASRPPLPPNAVLAPPDLVDLIGEERLRKLHAAIARKLRALRAGGTVTVELEAGTGGLVIAARVGDREPKL